MTALKRTYLQIQRALAATEPIRYLYRRPLSFPNRPIQPESEDRRVEVY